MDPRCQLLVVMGKTDPEAARHRQQSMILVPGNTPAVHIERSTTVFGRQDQHGHAEVLGDDVRVPVTNLLGEEGAGFAIAQTRLGPGRIPHCRRALGASERALAMMVSRADARVAFGAPLSEQGAARQQIAESGIAIDQARMLYRHAAKVTDEQGNKAAAGLVAMANVAVPRAALDRAIDEARTRSLPLPIVPTMGEGRSEDPSQSRTWAAEVAWLQRSRVAGG